MGNANTKESRGESQRGPASPGYDGGPGTSPYPSAADRSQSGLGMGASRRHRPGRTDIGGLLGLGGSSSGGAPGDAARESLHQDRRETRAERETRRAERDRQARIKERERSLREEHVDGGYLVTLGTYTGPEDFNKPIVRQLQMERKLAPFWRGLNDLDSNWTEFQIIAAARGLPIPPADQAPPEELRPRPLSLSSPAPASQQRNVNNLTLTLSSGDRGLSTASDRPAGGPAGPARTSSPFKPLNKSLAAVLGGSPVPSSAASPTVSHNGSAADMSMAPREVTITPHDPYVNGQPMEVFLYKDATECPICFLTYPPYLNQTRCCAQPICSECFVQIKRPDPHFPDGHNDANAQNQAPGVPVGVPEEAAGLLVSEPACCPYCTQPEFGVTFDPPPFRRGLTYATPFVSSTVNPAMSSTSSLQSGSPLPSPLLSPTGSTGETTGSRRRNQSLSVNAPNVITTDRIRPEWATKLQSARAHQARRAAAATALHTAAFLMGNNETTRGFRSRFSRRNQMASGPGGGSATAASAAGGTDGQAPSSHGLSGEGDFGGSGNTLTADSITAGGENRDAQQRTRMEQLEDMMLMEAIRLSLATEEERKRKAEKEEQKEAKKREKKEQRKATRRTTISGDDAAGDKTALGQHSLSSGGSSLSLHGLVAGLGYKRGNSSASLQGNDLRAEPSAAGAGSGAAATDKGGVHSTVQTPALPSPATDQPATPEGPGKEDVKGKGVDRGEAQAGTEPPGSATTAGSASASGLTSSSSSPPSIPTPRPPMAGPSHLRQMSNASSASSSMLDVAGSYAFTSSLLGQKQPQDPYGSGLSLGGSGDEGGDGADDPDRDPSASTEPMFNFRSLAEVVGVTLEGQNAGRRISRVEAERKATEQGAADDKKSVPFGAGDDAFAKREEAGEVFENEHVEVAASDGGAEAQQKQQRQPSPSSPPKSMSPGAIDIPTPLLIITPVTPALTGDEMEPVAEGDSKQLEYSSTTTAVEVLDSQNQERAGEERGQAVRQNNFLQQQQQKQQTKRRREEQIRPHEVTQ